MWDRYINKNHRISDASLVDAVILKHAVLYNPTLRHIDLNEQINDEVFYHCYLTVKNISTIHLYKVHKNWGIYVWP